MHPSDTSEDESVLSDVEGNVDTSELMRRAKEAGNMLDNPRTGSKKGGPVPGRAAEQPKKRKGAMTAADSEKSPEGPRKKKSRNSEIFPLEHRPDWLKKDSVINSLNPSAVGTVIARHKMTEALDKQNSLKEEKANKLKGGLRVDQDIKMIIVQAGEDNATNVLHMQRF